MPGAESAIVPNTSGAEAAIPGSDYENLADVGPADLGRADVNLYGQEYTRTIGSTGSESAISAQ